MRSFIVDGSKHKLLHSSKHIPERNFIEKILQVDAMQEMNTLSVTVSNMKLSSPSDLALSTLSLSPFKTKTSSHKAGEDDAKSDIAQSLTLPTLPTDILVQLNSYLSKVASTCLGLTCKAFYSIHFHIHGKVKPMTYELPTYAQLWMRLSGERDCLDENSYVRVISGLRYLRVGSARMRVKYERGWMVGGAEEEEEKSWVPGNMWFDPFSGKFRKLKVGESMA